MINKERSPIGSNTHLPVFGHEFAIRLVEGWHRRFWLVARTAGCMRRSLPRRPVGIVIDVIIPSRSGILALFPSRRQVVRWTIFQRLINFDHDCSWWAKIQMTHPILDVCHQYQQNVDLMQICFRLAILVRLVNFQHMYRPKNVTVSFFLVEFALSSIRSKGFKRKKECTKITYDKLISLREKSNNAIHNIKGWNDWISFLEKINERKISSKQF